MKDDSFLPILISPAEEEEFKKLFPDTPYLLWNYVDPKDLEKKKWSQQ